MKARIVQILDTPVSASWKLRIQAGNTTLAKMHFSSFLSHCFELAYKVIAFIMVFHAHFVGGDPSPS
ncbi:hypothetical protein ACQP3L_32905, partial [Escherichia coli]